MRLIKMFLFVLPSVLSSGIISTAAAQNSVLICYGRLNPSTIRGFNYVILESQYYNKSEIKQIKSQNKKVVAYISIGEVNEHAKHYPLLKGQTVGKNEIWNSHYLNLEAAETREILMSLIDRGLDLGYDGFFLDNIDNYCAFGPQKSQKEQLKSFLAEIHRKYPDETFIQNAGLEVISETAPFIDAVLVESVATDYSFKERKYRLRDAKDFMAYSDKLKAVSEAHNVPILLAEYADTVALRDQVERRLKPLGHDYFIGQINLQTIPSFKR